MEIRELPALRVLILFSMCYFLLIYLDLIAAILICIVFGVFLILKLKSFKNSFIIFSVILICCFRIAFKPQLNLPLNFYKIERIVKSNKEKIIFIAKGSKKVLFNIKFKGNQSTSYYPSDIIEYRHRLTALPNPKDLDGFIYIDYLKNNGVDSVAYPAAYPKVVLRNNFSIMFYALKIRKSIIAHLLSFSEVSKLTKGFTIALLTGDKSFLDQKGHQLFRESGVIHVLAISGLHVGILYATLYFLFSKLFRLKPKLSFLTISLILIVYAFITGMSPSVIRAVLMFVLIHFGKSFQKSVSTLNIIFSSAVLMLFFKPDLILDVGFQLSYSAVIGIVLTMQYSGLKECVKLPYFRVLWNILLVNMSAFIFTAPVIAFHFGLINFTSIWASVIVVPLITVAMYTGVLLLIISFNNFLAEKIFLMLDYLFLSLDQFLNFIIDYFQLTFQLSFNITSVVIYFSILFFFVVKRVKIIFFGVAIVILVFFFPKSQKFRFLKLDNNVHLKFKNEIFHLKKGDSMSLQNIDISYQEINKIEVRKNDSIKIINFNVENYHSLILDL